MTTAAHVLDVARSQIGVVQASNGANPYGAAYGMDRVAWCMQFAWWCAVQAGAADLVPRTAYTPTAAAYYQQRGRADRTPRVGSLAFYDWPGDGVDRISHVAWIEAVHPDGTTTNIEGNTTSGTKGDQRMGGGVWRRRRSTSALIVCGHPAYDGAPRVAPAGNPADPGAGMATLSYGMRSDSRVEALQRFLNRHKWNPALPLLTPLGNYLEQTVAVVAAAQRQCGVTGPDANGRTVGPRTRAAFAARGARW